MVLLRMWGSGSAVQNCDAATVAFHIEYSLTNGQQCVVFMIYCRCWLQWKRRSNDAVVGDCTAIYNGIWKYHHEKDGMGFDRSNWCQWCMSFNLCVHAICAWFFKGEQLLLFCNLVKLLLSFKVNGSFMCGGCDWSDPKSCNRWYVQLLCSLDFGYCIQWSRCRNSFCLCLLLLLTLCPGRFLFYTQVMILMRSYYRLSSLAITSVDGCYFYIIIHNSILCRTWL